MKKAVILIFVLLSVLSSTYLSCTATDSTYESIPESIKEDLFSILQDDVKDALEDMGISENTFENLYNVSFSNIGNYFKETLSENIKQCFGNVSSLFALAVLIGVVSVLFKGEQYNNYFSLFSVITISLFTVSIIQNSLNTVVSVIKLSSNFMLSFVPVYTLIISFSGNPAGALTYNSLALFFAESVSSFISYAFVDFMGLYFCFSLSFLLNEGININRFLNVVNKTVSVVLGLAASVFTGFLSIRSVLSVAVDTVSVKSIRFLISSLIPVVGSSISEAYSTLLGSINLIKGSAAVVGIIAILVINLPVISETLVYYISFSLMSFVCEGFGATGCCDVLRCFSCGIKIMLLLCVFEMFLLIISTGIMLSFKGG